MQSNHFNGQRYFNPGVKLQPFSRALYWMLTRSPAPWPHSVPVQQQKITRPRVQAGELAITFINHSTCLIQVSGWNILTDPIWSERASPFKRWGPRRSALPGVRFEDLPPIDLVLISHNHYDHMDLPSLQRLQQVHEPVFFIPQGNFSYLKAKGLKNMKELDWWEQVDFSMDHQLIFVPSQHFSARGIWDRNKTLWGGFVIKGPKHSIYFAGDTGYGPHFTMIRERLGPPRLSFLPIGAFKPEWFMHSVHISPAEAVQAHLDLQSKQSVAIHFGTFQMADDGIDEPILALEKEMDKRGLPQEQFWILKNGESKEIY
ncbi:MBL fold metallo-hydrolase [Candidatus Protochlamydia phocaeensis]|uniref:MBL fold metallo-hydrolase n=1 Tax=Candidatus Protochlamydia phocaeensis TaxID=1414722 RepID=UPI0008399C91|nr:MBL fold metallo-hydrolase [Candidatus Protochlamydia phocaeensis]